MIKDFKIIILNKNACVFYYYYIGVTECRSELYRLNTNLSNEYIHCSGVVMIPICFLINFCVLLSLLLIRIIIIIIIHTILKTITITVIIIIFKFHIFNIPKSTK